MPKKRKLTLIYEQSTKHVEAHLAKLEQKPSAKKAEERAAAAKSMRRTTARMRIGYVKEELASLHVDHGILILQREAFERTIVGPARRIDETYEHIQDAFNETIDDLVKRIDESYDLLKKEEKYASPNA
jgi:hypothetical protein